MIIELIWYIICTIWVDWRDCTTVVLYCVELSIVADNLCVLCVDRYWCCIEDRNVYSFTGIQYCVPSITEYYWVLYNVWNQGRARGWPGWESFIKFLPNFAGKTRPISDVYLEGERKVNLFFALEIWILPTLSLLEYQEGRPPR